MRMVRVLLAYILFGALFVPVHSVAIDVGSVTHEIPAERDFVTKLVRNNTSIVNAYQLSLQAISRPDSRGEIVDMSPGELLFHPRQKLLRPGEYMYVRFVYNGPKDGRERYYRAVFTEVPAAVTEEKKGESGRQGSHVTMSVALETILVVRPRLQSLDYRLEPGIIENTGNTFFLVIAKQHCDQPDEDANSRYVMPGESFENPRLLPDKPLYLLANGRYHSVGLDCSQQD